MQGAGSKGAPEGRCLLGWTYVARGSALLALPIEPPGKSLGSCGIAARCRTSPRRSPAAKPRALPRFERLDERRD